MQKMPTGSTSIERIAVSETDVVVVVVVDVVVLVVVVVTAVVGVVVDDEVLDDEGVSLAGWLPSEQPATAKATAMPVNAKRLNFTRSSCISPDRPTISPVQRCG
jgi:hypothetical protein